MLNLTQPVLFPELLQKMWRTVEMSVVETTEDKWKYIIAKKDFNLSEIAFFICDNYGKIYSIQFPSKVNNVILTHSKLQ